MAKNTNKHRQPLVKKKKTFLNFYCFFFCCCILHFICSIQMFHTTAKRLVKMSNPTY